MALKPTHVSKIDDTSAGCSLTEHIHGDAKKWTLSLFTRQVTR